MREKDYDASSVNKGENYDTVKEKKVGERRKTNKAP